jgi:hypothetical protein
MFHGALQVQMYKKNHTGVPEMYERRRFLPSEFMKVISWHVQFLLGSLFQSMDVTKLL